MIISEILSIMLEFDLDLRDEDELIKYIENFTFLIIILIRYDFPF